MSLPICEICQEHKASILICLQQDGQSEKHHVCMACIGEIADGELAELLNHSHLDFSKLKAILHQMQNWQEPMETAMDNEELVVLQKLQAMMGDDEAMPEDVLSEAIEKVLSEGDADIPALDEPRCSQCGTSWKSIHEDGLVGCPHCYVDFAEPLQKVMHELHLGTAHVGKIPRFREKQERMKEHHEKRQQHRLEMLQNRLDAALQAENYEEAAQIRDKIAQVAGKY